MYKFKKPTQTGLKVNQGYTGETIEQKIFRIVNNKEPITDGAPLIYTERKDGVLPAYDIRTDRFEIAVEAMDKVHKAHLAKREERAKIVGIDENSKNKPENNTEGKTQSTPGTTSEGSSDIKN